MPQLFSPHAEMKVFSGNANRELASRICDYLEIPLGNAHVSRFPDGEIDVKFNEDVRGRDVFLVQPTCPPVNENLMELLVMIDCAARASAGRVTAVIPYFGYARKDRKDEGRVPITAKLVANLLTKAGANRVLTLDLHATQIQGFFDIPVDHLFAAPIMCHYFREMNLPNLVLVAPDVGSVKVARAYAKVLRADLAVVDKRRASGDEIETMFVMGNVAGKTALIVDDMITTGGTACEAAKALKERGAEQIYMAATHAVLCGPAVERLGASPIAKVVVTDSIPLTPAAHTLGERIKVLSAASLLGEAIRRIHCYESLSSLFSKFN